MLSMSDVQRLDGWETALRALRAHPGRTLTFGWGPETFQSVYRLHRTQASADVIGYDRVADHVHNLPLELLVTLGVVGAASFVYLAWSLWKEADAEGRAALLGLGAMAMVEPIFFPPAALLFLLLGARRQDMTARRAPGLGAAILAIAFALVWWFDFHSLTLHPHESEANQLMVMDCLRKGRPDLAVVYARRAAAADPMHRPLVAQAARLEAAVNSPARQ